MALYHCVLTSMLRHTLSTDGMKSPADNSLLMSNQRDITLCHPEHLVSPFFLPSIVHRELKIALGQQEISEMLLLIENEVSLLAFQRLTDSPIHWSLSCAGRTHLSPYWLILLFFSKTLKTFLINSCIFKCSSHCSQHDINIWLVLQHSLSYWCN